MLGDKINIRPEYFATAKSIVQLLEETAVLEKPRPVVAVSGESGSGKSVTAVCMQKALSEAGRTALILHLDDYFRLPPLTNHEKRKEDISWVGPQEVHMTKLQQHVDAFHKKLAAIVRPVVVYRLNTILEETLALSGYDCLIVEGTYTFLLERLDALVFMDRTYLETKEQRASRGRDVQEDFVEEVLAIEHGIIRKGKSRAQIIVHIDYSVGYNTTQA